MPLYSRRKFLTSVTVAMSFTAGCSLMQTNDGSTLEFSLGERVDSRLSIAESSAFFTTKSGSLYSVSLNAGETNWKQNISDSGVATTPALEENRVYGGENTMYGFSGDGEDLWSFSLFDQLSSAYIASVPPLVTNDQVVFGLTNGKLCALSADEGDLCWTRKVGTESCHRWSEHGGRIVTGTPGGSIAFVDPKDESVRRREYHEPVAPRISPNGIYVGGQSVRKLSTDLAKEQWTVETEAQYTYLPTVSDGQVFVSGANVQGDTGYLYSIDAETGTLDWKQTTDDGISGYPLVDTETGHVVVGTMNDGTVFTFDSGGDTVQSTRIERGISGPLKRYGDDVLALAKSGSIYSVPLP